MTAQQGGGVALEGRATTAVGAQAGSVCVLPGCRNSVSEQGLPCDECMAEFGSHLRATDGPRMTAESQAARDRETQHSYALQWAGGNPASIAAAVAPCEGRREAKAGADDALDRKANQRCWLCEERRTCTKQENGWECDTCGEIR